jgi:hypothetical protein
MHNSNSAAMAGPSIFRDPMRPPSVIRRRIEQLRKHLGSDGFEFETAA